MSDKTIFVTGATGGQGGSVVRHLLADGKFKVKALTRNPDSDKAKELKALGAELVKGDANDEAAMAEAMKGCYGVFGVTNFWEHFDKEYDHGINIINAVVKSGVPNFVLSTLANYEKITNGKFKVPHFDLKAKFQEHAASVKPDTIFIHVAFYYENFLSFFPPQKNEDGSLSFGFPQGDTKLSAVAVEDVGGIVNTIFNDPEQFYGKVIGAVGEDITGNEYADIMTKVLGKKFNYSYIPHDVYSKLDFPGAEELANMFEAQRLFVPQRQKDLEEAKRLFPGIRSFEQWLGANKDKFASVIN